MDWRKLSERYRKLTWEQQLGNLASTLARSATASGSPRTEGSVSDLLREGMWILEWTAGGAPAEMLIDLAAMQSELALLNRAWNKDRAAVRPLLAFRARHL